MEAGCSVSLNSDDPPYFATSVGREYAVAAEHFGLGREDLMNITRDAIEASFADDETKSRLRARLKVL
jgi:adenosine deaminase